MCGGKNCGDMLDVFATSGDCGKCHKGMKPGVIDFMISKPVGDAFFSHEFHLQVYKCADCHTKIFPYKVVVGTATMEDMKAGKSCGACHGKGKDAFAPAVINCKKCHTAM